MEAFFTTNSHLKLSLQHLDLFGGCWKIQIYNTTIDYACMEPIFEHLVTDDLVKNCKVSFETLIMTPILNWWEDKH
jgi:hypothetical protein